MLDAIRVVHVVLSMDVGGMERGLVNQIRAGKKLGEKIFVVCLERPGTLASQLEAMDVPVACVNKLPGVRLGTIARLRKLFLALRPDVVHTHQAGALFYAGPAARLAAVRLVVHTEHGKHYAKRIRTRWLGRLGARYVRKFFCLTEDIAREVAICRVAPRRKIQVIPNGIDLSRFQERGDKESLRARLELPAGVPLIGTIGRLVEVKRQDVLIQAFARVRKQVGGAELLLVGDGPLRASLEKLAHDFGVSAVVHFVGYQPRPEQYLRALDVFALTSSREGMPQTVMEAAAAGIPVIASRVGGVPEIIEHGRNGLMFPAGDDDALAEGLMDLLTNTDRAAQFSREGKRVVEARFDVQRMAADYHSYFCAALAQKRTPYAVSAT